MKNKQQKKTKKGGKHKAHDILFKTVFSKRREAANLLRNFGDPIIVKGLDFRTLKRETDSFAEANLKEYFSDLVYSCRWKGHELRICLLFEHKSYPVEHPHFQLLRYMLNCWENDLSQKRKLRPVIPIVVYHGKEHWQYKKLSDYFDISAEALRPYCPNFEYHLLDLSKYEDENILSLQAGYYVNTLFLLKHQKQKEFILSHLNSIFLHKEELEITEEGKIFIKSMLHYLTKTNKFEKQEKTKLMKFVFGTNIEDIDPDNIDNTYDELLMEGYQKGILEGKKEGKVEGLLEGEKIATEAQKRHIIKMIEHFPSWTDEEVASFVETTIKKVQEIRVSLKSS